VSVAQLAISRGELTSMVPFACFQPLNVDHLNRGSATGFEDLEVWKRAARLLAEASRKIVET